MLNIEGWEEKPGRSTVSFKIKDFPVETHTWEKAENSYAATDA
jgi:hypothetical protein